MPKTGRPTKYSPRVAEQICALLMEGYSLRAICKQEEMPCLAIVCRWLAQKKDFVEQYARAREVQAEIMADEILDIADDATNDYIERESAKGNVTILVDHDHIARSKLRVDARKWVAEKLLPKKYGQRKALEFSDPNGEPLGPPVFNINFVKSKRLASEGDGKAVGA